ncbi:MAG TPA: hypothetical protein VGH28_31835 [Polyangiaceae bacterium]
MPGAFVAATRAEMNGDDKKALELHEGVIQTAVGVSSDAHRVAALLASLDAVAEGGADVLRDVSTHTAILDRTKDGKPVLDALATDFGLASDPFAKGILAQTLAERAEQMGDAPSAERWRLASGCARDVTVVGPVDWTRIASVREGGPLAAFDAPLAATYAEPGPFGAKTGPLTVSGRTCDHSVASFGTRHGVHDVVVDADVPEDEDIGVMLRADRAATLRVGGKLAIDRASELGTDDVVRFARVHVGRGRVRIVARVASGDFGFAVLDAHGDPLKLHAPTAGERGTSAATSVKGASPSDLPEPGNDAERTLFAAASLAAGDAHAAERMLAARVREDSAPPEVLLLYTRALDAVRDIDAIHRAERERAACDKLLEKSKGAWEANIAHAELAGVRKGASEAKLEALHDLDEQRKNGKASTSPLLDAFEAALAGREGLHERARTALERARTSLAGTRLFRDVERVAEDRSAEDRVAFECATVPGSERGTLGCYFALRDVGKLGEAGAELARVRKVLGAPNGYAAFALRDALVRNDASAARAAEAVLLPGERTLSGIVATAPKRDRALRDRILAAATDAEDSPNALPSLLLSLGEDPAAEFEGVAARLAAEDRKSPKLAGAATAILAHTERYDVGDDGLVRYVYFDVRRVSGTTDIEENAAAPPPNVAGRGTMKVLRRRIHKRDGRVLEPERNPGAAQSHAELAQLEQGDIVEALYEGISIPSETGDIGIDTPDLLPERTAVATATIQLTMPTSLKPALWVHPILGKASESVSGDKRTLTWQLKDHNARRLEEGVPRTEREVGIVMGTTTWSTVARALKETLLSLADHDQEVAAWAAQTAAKHPAKSRELVDAIVAGAGHAVREASGSIIADFGFGFDRASTTTARTILVNHEGSRTWLIARALSDLGVPVDVGVSESEPYSADPSYPASMSRFSHPLAVAHVEGQDVWIDADVSGPPLPAGRISPELRGRSVLFADGTIKPAPSMSLEKERDEVDLRLVVDEKGDAKGELTVLLRGRAAQQISEAMLRLVGFERERALFGIALGWVPFANVDKVALSSTEGSWQIALRANISVPGYAQPVAAVQKEAKSWLLPGLDPIHHVFPRSSVSTVAATYAGQSARENALSIRQAVQYHVHRRVELPKGSTVLKSPGPTDVQSANLEGKRAMTVAANVVEDDFALSVTTGTVAPSRYGEFVDSARKVDDSFLASTRVKLP